MQQLYLFARHPSGILTRMKNELIKERSLNHKLHQHIAMINVNLQKVSREEDNNAHHEVAGDLDHANREKLAKMANRSISNVSRRASIVDLSMEKVPRVLKSLGWCTVSSK